MICEGVTQLEHLCCKYNVYDHGDHVHINLDFLERNKSIKCIKRRTCMTDLTEDKGLSINENVNGYSKYT